MGKGVVNNSPSPPITCGRDRDVYRRQLTANAREREIMKDVDGWEMSLRNGQEFEWQLTVFSRLESQLTMIPDMHPRIKLLMDIHRRESATGISSPGHVPFPTFVRVSVVKAAGGPIMSFAKLSLRNAENQLQRCTAHHGAPSEI